MPSQMSRADCTVAVDLGTQGTKAALVTADGKLLGSAFVPSNLNRPAPGQVEQDPDEMFGSVVAAIRSAVDRSGVPPGRVAAIGIGGQMAGVLGIDENWHAVTPYDSWLDSRCEAAMPLIRDWGEEAFIGITGSPVTYAHGPKILWWRRERLEVYGAIAKFLVPSAYVAGRLAGLRAKDAYIDHTHLHFTGFADVRRMSWSDELLRAFGIDGDKMPTIVRPWDIVGGLTDTYAAMAGLLPGTPIAAGLGDTAAATLGAGIARPGLLFDVAGTASVLSCCTAEYRPDTEGKTLIYARSALPDLWTPLAYINGGGQCLAWYKRLTGLDYDELNALAEAVDPGCGGLTFIPHFGGRVCPNTPALRGSWSGLAWSHERGALFRAILESVAYEYKHYLGTLGRLVGQAAYEAVHVAGGGARSALFNRIKADALGIPYRPLQAEDTALMGAALVAGHGVGLFPDPAASAERFAAPGEAIQPDADRHRQYAAAASRYRRTVDGMQAVYASLDADE
ncbi:FGGY family carbohydrate kinase [Cohnella ginsengisoli]|uniref:FGGY family carbohydrate kinase n=1 Tax=Cohnella ginsengisoli TaxID=425004 RepID=A0A9X4QPW0_9BACL|nr:FGGY family carbohydrate kinase [Cohnella ginsengisoli]MDG0793912.1 FGGY family carbohydrate kinase [Cohnella ginsengisoli]